MNEEPQRNQIEVTLASMTERLESEIARFFRENPGALRPLLALVLVLLLSPLLVFWLGGGEGKDWSDTVKNVVESVAVLGGLLAVFKWVSERRDRATDILLKLEEEFKKAEVMAGRNMVEDTDYQETGRSDKLDALLRFYVVLYGVSHARQVPEESLSICFRYWLSHYFRKDRTGFRGYVERSYPTLTQWLRTDCKNGLPFFRPHRLFPKETDHPFIEKCRKEPIP